MSHMKATLVRAARWGALVLSLSLVASAAAQKRWSWPDHAKNLKVLPEDTDADHLRDTMQGFTRALGVRCSHCHEEKEGQSFADIDFASDANPNKDRARTMMKMLGSIRKQMAGFPSSAEVPAEVSCITCHRGAARPVPLADILWNTYHGKGVQAAVDDYHSLRAQYYGHGTYDFSESSLNEVGYRVLQAGDTDGAITLLTLNRDLFPESGNVWDSLAEAVLKKGDRDHAIEYYRKSLELDPHNRNAQHQLQVLGAAGGGAGAEGAGD
jgi:tetratricopeptide (TPR) repeat protein